MGSVTILGLIDYLSVGYLQGVEVHNLPLERPAVQVESSVPK